MKNPYNIPGFMVIQHERNTFRWRGTGIVPVANCTDLLTLTGAAGTVARLLKLEITGSATAATLLECLLLNRTSLDIGGTSAAQTNVHASSPSGASITQNCALNLYSANPTALGTGPLGIDGSKLFLPAAATPVELDRIIWLYGDRIDCPPTLISASSLFALNLNAASLPAGISLDISIEWTEDNN